MPKKLRKLIRDPVAYCLDSKHRFLRQLGDRALAKQTARYRVLGAKNSHRKITVIMTAYNTGDLVKDAVLSVLQQSHENFELMVIDDASTDSTLNVLKDLAAEDSRIRVFHAPKNHGTYWSKNWCLSKATGEFVAFHDSDDVSDPLRLQMQLGAMLDGKGVMATTCRWKRITPEGKAVSIDGQSARSAIISLMIRRAEVIEKVGYFDTVRIAADSEYHARIVKAFGHKQLRNMRQTLYTGLLREQSLTRGEEGGFNWQESGTDIRRSIEGDRALYRKAYKDWHSRKANLFVDFPQASRPFDAPDSICTFCDDKDMTQVVDVTAEGNHA